MAEANSVADPARIDDLMTPATTHTPLGELIAGLDDVAALAIPYTRLPTRARNA